MIVIHQLTIACRCPVDNRQDIYSCTVQADRVVKVEDILASVERATKAPAFQETITERIAEDIGCKVTTTGRHSGVDTTVVCGDDE